MEENTALMPFYCPKCGCQSLVVGRRQLFVYTAAPQSGDNVIEFVEYDEATEGFVPIARDVPQVIQFYYSACKGCGADVDVTPDDPIGQSIARVWPTLGGQAE